MAILVKENSIHDLSGYRSLEIRSYEDEVSLFAKSKYLNSPQGARILYLDFTGNNEHIKRFIPQFREILVELLKGVYSVVEITREPDAIKGPYNFAVSYGENKFNLNTLEVPDGL